MPLSLNVSNSLAELAKKFAADIKKQNNSVFQPYYIVTQTDGMNNWLKLQIAQHNGIAANCFFTKPNDLVQQVYMALGGRYTNSLSAASLTWLLYSILGKKEFNDRYRNIADYYATDSYDKDIKRFALATKVADLFDQYQVYRPDMIKNWNETPAGETGEWQHFLWTQAKELSANALPDKTVVRDYIVSALKDPSNVAKLQSKMPEVYLFGLSVTTAYHLNVFNAVAEAINIKYYLLNPAPAQYWFDDKSEKQIAVLTQKGLSNKIALNSGNPLLTHWGRVISDTFYLLFQNEDLLNAYEETGVTEPAANSLLHKIQHDIFNNATDDRNEITAADIADESVTINACYTTAREVEVLYNYLVHLVDKRKESLSPKDIVVMVTDIDAYAPYIKAVFSNAPYRFRYTIADESFNAGDSMMSALKSVLQMNRQNFKAEEVLQLLDSAYIRKRFGIANLQLIRKVVDKANIRFGMEGRREDETLYVSWPYGIDRIMYGICMSGDDEYDTGTEVLYPLDIVEGADALELVRFVHFVEVLTDSINERRYDRTISEWVEYIERVLQNLVCEAEDDLEEEYSLILNELEQLNAANELMKEKISFEIFSYSFVQSLSLNRRSGSFAGGGITFCSLIPMRSIPFKVVALLGLSFDKFPRRENNIGFNLMDKKRIKGDRNIKDNDKHLFLETILSARQYLYTSYIGQSTKDNTHFPPSALLDELIDYIETGADKDLNVRQLLIHRHPLHSFSRKYNRNNNELYTYLDDKTISAKQYKNERKEVKHFEFEEISLNQLLSFFKHPFKAYYNKVLSIYYENKSVLLSETELFNLDSLQKWSMKQNLLHVKQNEITQLKEKMVKTGELPLKNMADIAIAEVDEDVEKVRTLFIDCIGDDLQQTLDVELAIDETILKGTLDNLYRNKLVYISYSKSEYKYMLDAYIGYLCAKAHGDDVSLHFISATQQEIYIGTHIAKEEAIQKLEELVRLYKKGHEQILMFHPLLKTEPHKVDDIDDDIFNKLVDKAFNNFNMPCEDKYLVNEYAGKFFNRENAAKQFRENCTKLVKPLAALFPGYFN